MPDDARPSVRERQRGRLVAEQGARAIRPIDHEDPPRAPRGRADQHVVVLDAKRLDQAARSGRRSLKRSAAVASGWASRGRWSRRSASRQPRCADDRPRSSDATSRPLGLHTNDYGVTSVRHDGPIQPTDPSSPAARVEELRESLQPRPWRGAHTPRVGFALERIQHWSCNCRRPQRERDLTELAVRDGVRSRRSRPGSPISPIWPSGQAAERCSNRDARRDRVGAS
jgi:hypothetical protein